MKTIAVSEIQPGMVLARDVTDDAGKVLLGVSTALQNHHRSLLTRRGVATVSIFENDDAEASSPTPAAAAPAESSAELTPTALARVAEVEHLFEPLADDPLMAELRRLAVERAARGAAHA